MSTFVYTFQAIDDRGPCVVRFNAGDDTPDDELRAVAATGLQAMGYPIPSRFPQPRVLGDGTYVDRSNP